MPKEWVCKKIQLSIMKRNHGQNLKIKKIVIKKEVDFWFI